MNDQPETKAGADERLSLVDLLQPMETFKETDEDGNKRLVTENYVHEGCVLILCGTNGKPIGWLDTHAAVSGRVYRHHIIKPKSADEIAPAPPSAEPVASDCSLYDKCIEIIYPYTFGAFTGWKGMTESSLITLDDAEDHFTDCMAEMMDELKEKLVNIGVKGHAQYPERNNPTPPSAEPVSSNILPNILAYFTRADEGLGEGWAFPDDFSSYCLDYRGRDGTVFWLDIEDDSIKIVWKPTDADKPISQRFTAAHPAPTPERERIIEECARVAEQWSASMGGAYSSLAQAIRALAQPAAASTQSAGKG